MSEPYSQTFRLTILLPETSTNQIVGYLDFTCDLAQFFTPDHTCVYTLVGAKVIGAHAKCIFIEGFQATEKPGYFVFQRWALHYNYDN